MKRLGFRLIHREDRTFFEDGNGQYVPFPAGYITGPTTARDNGNPKPVYMSVKLADGTWSQRSAKADETEDLHRWALEEARGVLAGS